VEIGDSMVGNLIRIDNVIEGLPKVLDNTKAELDEVQKQLRNAKEEVLKPFKKEEELTEKSKRLSELEKELGVGTDVIEQVEETPQPVSKQRNKAIAR
jgi:predicted RNase H-like nuclease (RuvC/YqgF family)